MEYVLVGYYKFNDFRRDTDFQRCAVASFHELAGEEPRSSVLNPVSLVQDVEEPPTWVYTLWLCQNSYGKWP